MKKYSFISFLLLLSIWAAAQQEMYERFKFIQNGDTLPYRLLLPENYNPANEYPVIFFLHGRGESGSDNEKQLINGGSLFLRDSIRKRYPAIVVFPQCSDKSYWSNVEMNMQENGKRQFYFVEEGPPSRPMELLVSLTDFITTHYAVNKKQIYVMGLSMGGMGTFELVKRKPSFFAAAVPICGGAHSATARKIAKVNWWIFHGAKDDIVLPALSEKMYRALQQYKAKVRFTLYPTANHNSWDPAFAEPELLHWLFAQKKK